MSLWQAEVEQSKFSPDSLRHKQGPLHNFFFRSKSQKKSVPHSSPQYKFPQRPVPPQILSETNRYAISGAQEQIYEQPQKMQNYLVDRKVPKQRVWLEPAPVKVRTRVPKTHTEPPIISDHHPERMYQQPERREPKPSRNEPQVQSTEPVHTRNSRYEQREPRPPQSPAPRAQPQYFVERQPPTNTTIDQIANLIVQKSQLEQDIVEREARYRELLTESQNITKAMRMERDAAVEDVLTLRAATKKSAMKEPLPPKPRYSSEELEIMFKPREDYYFKEQFRQLELIIKNFVLNAMKSQPGMLRMVDLNPSMDFYISKHNMTPLTIFGIRDLRCIVCRGFIMEFLLERIFRVFLFGMVQGAVFKEGFQALSAVDIGTGSKWAASVARVLISTSLDYNPERAASEVLAEVKIYLAAFLDLEEEATGLQEVIMKAAEVARDCRLDVASFSLEMPSYGTSYNVDRMDAAQPEDGPVAVAYSPVVTKRGNRRGENYQVGTILCRAKVWRESIFAELQNLTTDLNDDARGYE